jgi:hypothetical protein
MMELLAGVPGKLKALADRLTATRAEKIDNLDVAVSTRAPANTAVSNAVLTDDRISKLDNLDNIAAPPDRLKSRTHYKPSVTGTGAVITYVSVPGNPAKIRVLFLGCWAPSGGTCSGGVWFDGATMVCQGNTAASVMTWSFIVEEYY